MVDRSDRSDGQKFGSRWIRKSEVQLQIDSQLESLVADRLEDEEGLREL